MNNKSITPNPQQPVDRIPTGQLPSALAELSEAALSGAEVQYCPSLQCGCGCEVCESCSYEGDED